MPAPIAVRARLQHLAPALLAPQRLAGPFARPEDFCKTRCEVDREASPRWTATALAAPFRYRFTSPPTDQSWLWREAMLVDPDGQQICLFHAGVNRTDPPWRLVESL